MECSSTSGGDNRFINACCCCLQDDCSLDISAEYFNSGQREVYETMLKETLNIQVTHKNIDPSHKWHICEPCVSRLRDASDFRRKVLITQAVLREHLGTLMAVEDTSEIIDSKDISISVDIKLPPANVEGGASFGEDKTSKNCTCSVTELQPGHNEPVSKVVTPESKADHLTPVIVKTEAIAEPVSDDRINGIDSDTEFEIFESKADLIPELWGPVIAKTESLTEAVAVTDDKINAVTIISESPPINAPPRDKIKRTYSRMEKFFRRTYTRTPQNKSDASLLTERLNVNRTTASEEEQPSQWREIGTTKSIDYPLPKYLRTKLTNEEKKKKESTTSVSKKREKSDTAIAVRQRSKARERNLRKRKKALEESIDQYPTRGNRYTQSLPMRFY